MRADLARRATGAADGGAQREAEAFFRFLADLAVEELIGGLLCVAGVLVAHAVGVVARVVGERRDQCGEVPHRVGVCLAAGGESLADEATLLSEIVEMDRGVLALVDAGAKLV